MTLRPLCSVLLITSLLAPWLGAADAPALAAATPAASASTQPPPLPETLLLGTVKALQHDDFTSFLTSLPAAQQAQIQAQWLAAVPTAAQAKTLDGMLAKYLAPKAVDQIVSDNKDAIESVDLNGLSQKLTMGSAMLPMLLGQAGTLTTAQQRLLPQLQQLLTDVGTWLPTSGIDDTTKVHQALLHVQAGLTALGVTTTARLRQLSFDQLLTRLGATHHELKQAISVFGISIDTVLASLTATSALDQGTDPTHRMLTVHFTAFAHPYAIELPVMYRNALWRIDPEIVPASVRNLTQTYMGGPRAPRPVTP